MPFQSCIEEVRSDNAQLGLLYQQLISLVTQIGVNSNVVKNDTIPAILQKISLLKQSRQTKIPQELLESHLAVGSQNSSSLKILEEDLDGLFHALNDLSKKVLDSPNSLSHKYSDLPSLLEELKHESVCDRESFQDYVHAQSASVTALNLEISELKTEIASLKRTNEEASSIYDKKVKSFKEDFDQQLHSILERIGGLNLNQDQPQNVEEVISALGNSPGNFNTAGNPNFTPLGNKQRFTTNFAPPQTTAFGNNNSTPNPLCQSTLPVSNLTNLVQKLS